MIRSLRIGCALAALILISAQAALCLKTPILPLSQVRAGQRATAKSVFRGTKIESFHIEIIGVLHKFEGTRSIILGRVLDGPVVARKSGIIAGMSGSPVYINGKLIGAVAYAWSWSKEPITGITPIEEMLEAWQGKAATETAGGSAAPLDHPVTIAGRPVQRVRVSQSPGQPDLPGTMTLVPLSGFIQASGFNQRAIGRLSELFAPYGMQVISGPSGGTENMRPPFLAGGALGAQLVGGDFDISALGTVTLVEGNRMLAFGHPLLELGDIDVPMTGAYVYDILPSVMISNKIMSGTQVVGRISRDTQTAIAGEIGAATDRLPVTIEVVDRDRGSSRQFHLQVARVRELLPGLTALSVVTAIDETRGRVSRGTARVVTEIEADGRPTLTREEFSYSAGDVAMAAMPAVVRPLSMFTDSPFGKLRLRRVTVRVEAEQERRTATIERVTIPQSRVKAGDEITVSVTLRPYGKQLVEVPIRLKLPRDLPRATVRLVISGGGDSDEARSAIGAPRPAPISLTQLVARYLEQDRRQDLVVQAALPRAGASLLGEELPDLPRGALEAIRTSHPTDLRPAASILKVAVPTQWSLLGRQIVMLPVESRIAPAAPVPQPSRAEGPPQQPSGGASEDEQSQGDDDEQWVSGEWDVLPDPGQPQDPVGAGPARGNARPAPPAAAKKEQPKAEQESKPLARGPQAWVQQAAADYSQAKLDNVAIAEDGRVTLGFERADPTSVPADVIWGLAVGKDGVFAGTGNDGVIYRVSGKGDVTTFHATGELNVHALAFGSDGSLYAGTSPRGKLLRISPDGSGTVIYDSTSTYLWALVVGPDGTVYAGGGAPARVYAVSPGGQAKVLAELPAANVLSLVRSPAGDLYAGTSDGGVIFRVKPDGAVSVVGRLPSNEVGALALDDKGNLYAAASPAGDIYRMEPDGTLQLYSQTAEKIIYALGVLPDGDLVAATGPGGSILRIGPDRQTQTVLKPETGVATALVVSGGAMYVGSTGPAAVTRFGPERALSGELESAVLNADRPARWGHVELAAETPTGTAVAVETRSGDAPTPEDHWSDWAPLSSDAISSPPANHLQYRMRLTTNDPKISPVVRQVRVAYQPANLPPAVGLKAPSGGERIQKKYTITWDSRDPDKDTLVYDVSLSRDLGKTWAALKRNVTEMKYDWDTTPTGDGRVMLKVTASDRQSRPTDPMQDDDVVVIWVDNTPPQVMLLRSSLAVGEDRRAQVSGMATDKLSPIKSVEYRVDDGEWQSLPLAAVDALTTAAAISTDVLAPGKHAIEARAFDAAGNVGSDKIEVEVKAATGPSEAAAKANTG